MQIEEDEVAKSVYDQLSNENKELLGGKGLEIVETILLCSVKQDDSTRIVEAVLDNTNLSTEDKLEFCTNLVSGLIESDGYVFLDKMSVAELYTDEMEGCHDFESLIEHGLIKEAESTPEALCWDYDALFEAAIYDENFIQVTKDSYIQRWDFVCYLESGEMLDNLYRLEPLQNKEILNEFIIENPYIIEQCGKEEIIEFFNCVNGKGYELKGVFCSMEFEFKDDPDVVLEAVKVENDLYNYSSERIRNLVGMEVDNKPQTIQDSLKAIIEMNQKGIEIKKNVSPLKQKESYELFNSLKKNLGAKESTSKKMKL